MLKPLATASLNQPRRLLVSYRHDTRNLREAEFSGRVLYSLTLELQPVVFRLAVRADAESLAEDCNSSIFSKYASSSQYSDFLDRNSHPLKQSFNRLTLPIINIDRDRKWTTFRFFRFELRGCDDKFVRDAIASLYDERTFKCSRS